jgi:hypothetical protein
MPDFGVRRLVAASEFLNCHPHDAGLPSPADLDQCPLRWCRNQTINGSPTAARITTTNYGYIRNVSIGGNIGIFGVLFSAVAGNSSPQDGHFLALVAVAPHIGQLSLMP